MPRFAPTTTGRLTQPPVESSVEVRAATPASLPDPATLARAYWTSARRGALGLVRPVGPPLGPVTLRAFVARGPELLRLGAAAVVVDERRVRVSFPILGGLVAGAEGGALVLVAERVGSDVLRLGVRVEGYTPRLYGPRAPLVRLVAVPYARAQAAVHDRVTSTYLFALERGHS